MEEELYEKAVAFGEMKHQGQKDDSGNDYFTSHCMIVALLLGNVVPDDENLVVAGLLHDTLEDTDTHRDELELAFGKDVADLVWEVTKSGKKDSEGFYFPNLKSRRGIMLKFAERLSNLSRMDCWDAKKQAWYLKQSKFWKSKIVRNI
jgi:GTP pyrophosphokinase